MKNYFKVVSTVPTPSTPPWYPGSFILIQVNKSLKQGYSDTQLSHVLIYFQSSIVNSGVRREKLSPQVISRSPDCNLKVSTFHTRQSSLPFIPNPYSYVSENFSISPMGLYAALIYTYSVMEVKRNLELKKRWKPTNSAIFSVSLDHFYESWQTTEWHSWTNFN